MRYIVISLLAVVILFCSCAPRNKDTKSSAWELVWSDEFSGSNLDTTNWNIRTAQPGWVNAELQEYV